VPAEGVDGVVDGLGGVGGPAETEDDDLAVMVVDVHGGQELRDAVEGV
jgi:hypothetical protein